MGAHLQKAKWMAACAAVLLAVMAGCGGGGGGGGGGEEPIVVPTGDYFPLGSSDRWLYDDVTQRVAGTRSVGGEMATVVQTTSAAGVLMDESLCVKNADGVRQLVADDADALTRAIGPLQLLRFPLLVGDSYTQLDKTVDTGMDLDGDGRNERMAVRSTVRVLALERVVVTLRTFDSALHVRTVIEQTLTFTRDGSTAAATVTEDDWRVADIGLVKSQITTVYAGQSDTAGIALSGYGVAGRRSESVAPTLLAPSPGDGAVVGPQPAVSAGFSEAMDHAALAGGAFSLVDAGGARVDGSLLVQGSNVVFMPTYPLTSGGYTARVSAAATDRVGNPLAAERSWHFTVDATGPLVVAVDPADGAIEVGVGQAITVTFSEPIDPASLAGYKATLEAAVPGSPSTQLSAQLQLSGKVLTITPSQPLPRAVEVRLHVSMLSDLLGNSMQVDFRSSFRTGAGRFAYPQVLPTGQSPVLAVAVGDVNGDGRPDVLLGTGFYFDAENDYRLVVFLQRADGTLAPPLKLVTGSSYTTLIGSLAVADVNGDGRQDVLVGEGTAGIEIFLQQSDGTLASAARLDGNAARLRVADLDGDGRPDIVALGFGSSGVQVWHGLPGGGYAGPVGAALNHYGWEDLALGDFNGDGRPDIAVTSGQGVWSETLALLPQRADGSFGPAAYRGGDSGRFAAGVAIGDISGDGRADLVVSNLAAVADSPYTALGLIRQNADGSLAATQGLATITNPGPLAVADIDGDGRGDIVVAHSGWMQLSLYLQRSDGTLRPEELFPTLYGPYDPHTLVVADVNGDGRPDIVLGGSVLLQLPVAAPAAPAASPRWPVLGLRPQPRTSP